MDFAVRTQFYFPSREYMPEPKFVTPIYEKQYTNISYIKKEKFNF